MAILLDYDRDSIGRGRMARCDASRDSRGQSAPTDRVHLSQRDFEIATEAIQNPPAPTEALRKAVQAKYGR